MRSFTVLVSPHGVTLDFSTGGVISGRGTNGDKLMVDNTVSEIRKSKAKGIKEKRIVFILSSPHYA
jgi:hypothetical protein